MTARSIDTGTQDLLASLEDGVLTLTMNRPEARNAMSRAMNEALAAQLAAAELDHEVKCIVLTGAGKGFCAGGDVKGMAARGDGQLTDRRGCCLRRCAPSGVRRRRGVFGGGLVCAVAR